MLAINSSVELPHNTMSLVALIPEAGSSDLSGAYNWVAEAFSTYGMEVLKSSECFGRLWT